MGGSAVAIGRDYTQKAARFQSKVFPGSLLRGEFKEAIAHVEARYNQGPKKVLDIAMHALYSLVVFVARFCCASWKNRESC